MAQRKRSKTWMIDYYDPTGKRVRQTFKKKNDAEEEHAKRAHLLQRAVISGREKKDYTTTLGELLEKYKVNFENQAGFRNSKKLF